jgi:hypothetical protein
VPRFRPIFICAISAAAFAFAVFWALRIAATNTPGPQPVRSFFTPNNESRLPSDRQLMALFEFDESSSTDPIFDRFVGCGDLKFIIGALASAKGNDVDGFGAPQAEYKGLHLSEFGNLNLDRLVLIKPRNSLLRRSPVVFPRPLGPGASRKIRLTTRPLVILSDRAAVPVSLFIRSEYEAANPVPAWDPARTISFRAHTQSTIKVLVEEPAALYYRLGHSNDWTRIDEAGHGTLSINWARASVGVVVRGTIRGLPRLFPDDSIHLTLGVGKQLDKPLGVDVVIATDGQFEAWVPWSKNDIADHGVDVALPRNLGSVTATHLQFRGEVVDLDVAMPFSRPLSIQCEDQSLAGEGAVVGDGMGFAFPSPLQAIVNGASGGEIQVLADCRIERLRGVWLQRKGFSATVVGTIDESRMSPIDQRAVETEYQVEGVIDVARSSSDDVTFAELQVECRPSSRSASPSGAFGGWCATTALGAEGVFEFQQVPRGPARLIFWKTDSATGKASTEEVATWSERDLVGSNFRVSIRR